MSKQPSSNLSSQYFGIDQAVQTNAEEGKWVYLQEATEVTGLSEKTLRRYIKKGSLKARRLGKLTNSPIQVLITPNTLKTAFAESNIEESNINEGASDILEVEAAEIDEMVYEASPIEAVERRVDEPIASSLYSGVELEKVVKIITEQFVEKLDKQKEVLIELRNELVEKERGLRLLPDLQKQLEEQEKMAYFKATALEKQVEELKRENELLKQPWWKKLLYQPPQNK